MQVKFNSKLNLRNLMLLGILSLFQVNSYAMPIPEELQKQNHQNTQETSPSPENKMQDQKAEDQKEQPLSSCSIPGDKKEAHYLFVQSAGSGTIKKVSKDSDTYQITLNNVSPFVICFTERPNRRTKLVPIKVLLDLWEAKDDESFKKDPPNADINGTEEKKNKNKHATQQEPLNYTVTLTEPKYDAVKKTLTYTLTLLPGDPNKNLPDSIDLRNITIFIDDVCVNCWFPGGG